MDRILTGEGKVLGVKCMRMGAVMTGEDEMLRV
jgi:hypothetical protein